MNILLHLCTLFIYLSALMLIGVLVLMAIAPEFWANNTAMAYLPLAFLLGITALALIAFPLSIMNIPAHLGMMGLTLAVALIIILIQRHKIATLIASAKTISRAPWAAWEIFVFGACTLLLLSNFILVAAYPQFDMDMISHILIKGKILADATYSNALYFHDPMFACMHNNYPPLPFFLQSFMFLWGLNSVADYQAINYLILVLTGLSLHNTLRPHIGPLQSLIWTFIFFSTAEYLRSQFIISSTDILLSLGIFLTAITFFNARKLNDDRLRILLAVLCGACLLIKVDALVFIAAFSIGIWVEERRFPTRHVLIMTAMIILWVLYRWTLPDPGTSGEYILRSLNKTLSLSTLPVALKTVSAVLSTCWSRTFLLIPLFWPFLVKKNAGWPLIMACLMTILVYALMLWFTMTTIPSYPLTFMRLLTHIYPLTLLISALALNALRVQPFKSPPS